MKGKITFLLMIFLVLFSFSVIAARNETMNTNLTIISVVPTVLSITLDDYEVGSGMDLIPGGESNLSCYGQVNDTNGLADIVLVKGDIFGPNSSYGDANNDSNYYRNTSCYYNSGTGNFNCTFSNIEFYADAGLWTCKINATDTGGNENSTENGTENMNSLLAIDITDSLMIEFGLVRLGDPSNAQEVVFFNLGNIIIDLEVDAYPIGQTINNESSMKCSRGSIPIGNMNVSLTSGSGYEEMVEGGVKAINANLSQAYGNDAVASNASSYWRVKVPIIPGLGGYCNGTAFIGATVNS